MKVMGKVIVYYCHPDHLGSTADVTDGHAKLIIEVSGRVDGAGLTDTRRAAGLALTRASLRTVTLFAWQGGLQAHRAGDLGDAAQGIVLTHLLACGIGDLADAPGLVIGSARRAVRIGDIVLGEVGVMDAR